ncbi:ATP-dependent DNA helicase RecG [Luteibaculum oceani]|uniref:ATP-dependent DNA helicase RecG n=1 Tax=Luteibaculum oceani TaxID=1294296 RepID=A0A5C6UY50_9FLAO|nr:ATP-dependent DNA helicase RecG [Luteibaculum oceani]TXC78332.1 ATP-dependent DNA helicase RecG [Luteibaculum oceani]
MLNLDTDITYLKGLGPERASTLKKELELFSARQLFAHFPFRYIDRSAIVSIGDIHSEDAFIQVKGRLGQVKEIGAGRKKRLEALLTDDSGVCKLIWFKGLKWVKPSLITGKNFVVFGKPQRFGATYSFAHPEITPEEKFQVSVQAFEPVYSSTELLGKKGLHSKGIHKIIKQNLPEFLNQYLENLPSELIHKYKLLSRAEAMRGIHLPRNMNEVKAAKRRLKFEELFLLQTFLLYKKLITLNHNKGAVFSEVGNYFNRFYKEVLPFELTNAQKRVLKEIRVHTRDGKQMNRLVQGDVGSGKTIVALMAMLLGIDNGTQACLMAPTEILARQHFLGIQKLVEPLGLGVALLTGAVKGAERKKILADTKSGELKILIGTHALIEDKVSFGNLGIAVIDEQHRFGVAQRAKLWAKNNPSPHVLVMTATPIPRTLAMTLYSDLEISVIDELPPGRKPIKTLHKRDSHREWVFGFMEQEIKKGRQVYVVYPLIEESESMDYKDLMDGYESITRRFQPPAYQISIVHGKMKPEDKEWEMQRFKTGITQILVATTVIEVGVDVPNASVMVIESAERFGLAQLHQLRGRVGRGAEQSFCILMSSNKLSANSKKRLSTMVETQDGFKIAEVDLELRGSGEIMGTRQSGDSDLKLADLVYDANMLAVAREEAKNIVEFDPNLEMKENQALKMELKRRYADKLIWSKIS